MSELDELKKAMKTNMDALSALIQIESNGSRIKQEIASNNRVLEGLHAKIKAAQEELEKTKSESSTVRTDAGKYADEILHNTSLATAEADKRLANAKMLERSAQTKLDDAEEINRRYQAMLSEVLAQKEKLKAALV